MLQVNAIVVSKLKNQPLVHGTIISTRKHNRTNYWTVRLTDGTEREFTSKGIQRVGIGGLHRPVQIAPGPDPEGNEEEAQDESETGSNPDENEEADMGGPRFDYSA